MARNDGGSGGQCLYPLVAARNTHRDVIEHIAEMLGGGVHTYHAKPPHCDSYQWMIWGQNALRVLRLIEPFLVRKQRQARVLLMAYNTWKPHSRYDEAGKERIRWLTGYARSLNKRGR